MNQTHRVVWSDSLHAFVVTSEQTKSRGKLSTTRRMLGTAVALGIGSLFAPYASAAGSCANSGANTVSQPTRVMCTLASGGTLNVTANGSITTVGTSVLLGPVAAVPDSGVVSNNLLVRNAGRLSASEGGSGILLDNTVVSGLLSNLAGGVIAADSGSALLIRDASLNGSVRNAGRIEAPVGSGIQVLNSRVAGDLDNRNALSARVGIDVQGSTVQGSILDKGNISSDQYAIHVDSSRIGGSVSVEGSAAGGQGAIRLTHDTIGGSVTNSGSLFSPQTAVLLDDTRVTGNLANSGKIEGRSGITVDGGSLGGLRNSGSVAGSMFAVRLTGTQLNGGIVNSGTLFSRSTGTGLLLDDSVITRGGITNTGNIEGQIGGLILNNSTVSGSINNSGQLTSEYRVPLGTIGLALTNSTLLGNINNTGAISGKAGLVIDQSTVIGNIDNRNSISGETTAMRISDSLVQGNLINHERSYLNSLFGLHLLNTTLTGKLINDGEIRNGFTSLGVADSRVFGGITNTGNIISFGTNGVSSSRLGSFLNTGTITANYAGLAFSNSQIDKALVNKGFINGVSVSGTQIGGGILNSGTIADPGTSDSGTGLIVAEGSVVQGGIVNSGLIGVDQHERFFTDALKVSDSSVFGGITNSGSLGGTKSLTLDQSFLSGNLVNAGKIDGYVDGLDVQNSRITGDIRNSGSISARLTALRVQESTVGGKLVNTGLVSSRLATLAVLNSVVTGGITNSGTLASQDGNYVLGSTIGGLVNAGTISGGGAGLTIDTTQINGAVVNSGLISGGRFSLLDSPGGSVKDLQITGQNTAEFRGEVLAPQARVSVAAGSAYTLNNGNLFTVTDFTNRGTLTLASGAMATIDGDYAQTSAATLRTQAADASTYGKLVVTGNATLPSRAKFDVDVIDSGQSFEGARLAKVLSAGTLQSNGSYAVTSNSALFNFSGVKNGNSVDLVAAPKSATAVSQAVQASGSLATLSAARALDGALASNAGLTPFFVGATSGAGVSSAIAQTLPSNTAATTGVTQSTLSTITDVIQARINANTGLASGDGFYGDKSLWMKPFGSWINQGERGDTPGYDASVYGMAFGVDAPVDELTRLGLSFSYANADTNGKSDAMPHSAKVDLYQLMGYGSHTLAPNTELSFHVGVGRNRTDGERNINLNGLGGKADADYDSTSFTAGAAVAKAFDLNPSTRFIPSVRADYTWLKDDSYHEKGSAALQPLLLDVKKHQTDQLILGLDGKLSHEIIPGTQVSGNLGVGYDVIHDDSMLVASYAGAPGQTFNNVGQSSSPWLARGGVGVSTRIASSGTELSVNYDAEARSDFTNQTVSLRLKMPF